MKFSINLFILILPFLLSFSNGEQCGTQAGGALCPNNLCCSEHGWCGSTVEYCGPRCQSGPCWASTPPPPPSTPSPPVIPSPPGTADITDIISSDLFEEMFRHRGDSQCEGAFYTYEAFVVAARYFPGFGTTGNKETKEREVAAFFGQTSQETTGGWEEAPGGKFAWGYCWVTERVTADYCVSSTEWPCAPGKQYYGRGPIQISYNYNYGQAGDALNLNLLGDPDMVARDPVVAFKTAIWFWMTPQPPKPSCHDVIIGEWTPTLSDVAAGRLPGYGVITNIINGGVECGRGFDERVSGRIGFYHRSSEKLRVSMGNNLDCYNQTSFGFSLRVSSM